MVFEFDVKGLIVACLQFSTNHLQCSHNQWINESINHRVWIIVYDQIRSTQSGQRSKSTGAVEKELYSSPWLSDPEDLGNFVSFKVLF